MSSFDPHTTPRTYITADIPGIGGILKSRPEDFLVEEIPAYDPCGSGEHIYLWIQKRSMSTMHLVRLLADHFRVKREAVGFAGMKDKQAVTTQLVSIHVPGKKDADFPAFQHELAQVLWNDRHTNKLRRGHLKGNRFIIRVRGVSVSKVVHAHKSLARLAAIGAPNRIGEQRFGTLRNNHVVGRALICGDFQTAMDQLLGPSADFPDIQTDARALYAKGEYENSLRAFPPSAHTERRCLAALARGGTVQDAARAIERMIQSFLVTAWQSAVFNALLDERIANGTYARFLEGDLAFKHDNGAVFAVDLATLDDQAVADPENALQRRLDRVAISPSGPMWGPEMTRASGQAGDMEFAVLDASGVSLADLELYWTGSRGGGVGGGMLGQRRALRIPVEHPDVEAGMDEHGEYIRLRFELPRGSFATTIMQEIMKTHVADESDEPSST